MRLPRSLLLLLAVVSCRTVAAAQSVPPINRAEGIVFSSDFEAGIPIGWTVPGNRTTTLAPTTRFLGRFGQAEFVQFSATNLTPGLSYTVMFDFMMIDSWDGNGPASGPDWFNITVDGTQVFRETFSNPAFTSGSTWSGEPDAGGSWTGGSWSDNIFRKVAVNFTPRTAAATIRFFAQGLQSIRDESWGIDNLVLMETRVAGAYEPAFTDVSRLVNFRGTNTTSVDNGCGLLWADMNGDGVPDCLMTGSSARLYTFNRSTAMYVATSVGTFQRQAAMADFDNDGDIDLFGFSSATGEQLMINNGAAAFTNGRDGGFSRPTTNEGVAAVDWNKDGLIDLVAMGGNGNWPATNTFGRPLATASNSRRSSTTLNTSPTTMFTHDATAPAWFNPAGARGNGHYVSAADVNADSVPDLFYHYGRGTLWLSQPDGRFAPAPARDFGRFSEGSKVGSAWGDYDNDGDFDLFVPSWTSGVAGALWQNEAGRFDNVAAAAGLTNGWGHRSACWGDYDNDGDLDLYIVCRAAVGNVLYENRGDGTFIIGDERCRASGMECGDAVFTDIDNDGDLELAVSGVNTNNRLFRNGVGGRNYLKVRVVGTGVEGTNTAGVTLTLFDARGGCVGTRQLGTARGFGGIEPLWAHFGGVDPSARYTVRVVLKGRTVEVPVVPGSVSTTIGPTTIPQMLTIDEAALPTGMKIIRWREVTSVE